MRIRRKTRAPAPQRLVWLIAGLLLVAGAAIAVVTHRENPGSSAGGVVDVCPIPSAQQLATDLVRSYAAKTGTPAGRFVLTNGSACDVRFTLAAESPDAVIAHDGIVAIVNPLNTLSRVSEKQLRAIFSGSVSDWSQLGGPPGPIIAILPDAASDESKVLASSLFFGVPIDNKVRRSPSSADVTRVVTGADKTSRSTIGLVAFSQAVSAKVVPLAYLPAPSVLSIASGRYPYTMTVAIKAASGHSADAVGLVDYARSRDGAAIVLKNGLIPREGL